MRSFVTIGAAMLALASGFVAADDHNGPEMHFENDFSQNNVLANGATNPLLRNQQMQIPQDFGTWNGQNMQQNLGTPRSGSNYAGRKNAGPLAGLSATQKSQCLTAFQDAFTAQTSQGCLADASNAFVGHISAPGAKTTTLTSALNTAGQMVCQPECFGQLRSVIRNVSLYCGDSIPGAKGNSLGFLAVTSSVVDMAQQFLCSKGKRNTPNANKHCYTQIAEIMGNVVSRAAAKEAKQYNTIPNGSTLFDALNAVARTRVPEFSRKEMCNSCMAQLPALLKNLYQNNLVPWELRKKAMFLDDVKVFVTTIKNYNCTSA